MRTIERLRIWDGRGVGYHLPSCLEQCLTAPGKVSNFMATNSIILQLRGLWDIFSGRFRQSGPHCYLQNVIVSHKLRSMLLTRIRPSIWVSLVFSSFRAVLDTLAVDTHNGVDLEFSHHVPRVEQKLFHPLRNPLPSWFDRVYLFPWHSGEPKCRYICIYINRPA